ncbi:hypothetical protein Tco_0158558 [Tanacetum coccineum]
MSPLFNSMLVQPPEDEGEVLERPSESQPIPSPTHPKGSGENHEGQSSSDRYLSGNEDGLTLQSVYDLCVSLCTYVTTQAAKIKDLKAQIKQLKKKARPGRKAIKSSKGAPSVQTHTDWDGLDADLEATLNEAMDYTFAEDEGKIDSKVEEPKTSSKTEELHLLEISLKLKRSLKSLQMMKDGQKVPRGMGSRRENERLAEIRFLLRSIKEEREKSPSEERAKLLHRYHAAQRKIHLNKDQISVEDEKLMKDLNTKAANLRRLDRKVREERIKKKRLPKRETWHKKNDEVMKRNIQLRHF